MLMRLSHCVSDSQVFCGVVTVPGLWKCCMLPREEVLIFRSCVVEPILEPPGEPCSGHSLGSLQNG